MNNWFLCSRYIGCPRAGARARANLQTFENLQTFPNIDLNSLRGVILTTLAHYNHSQVMSSLKSHLPGKGKESRMTIAPPSIQCHRDRTVLYLHCVAWNHTIASKHKTLAIPSHSKLWVACVYNISRLHFKTWFQQQQKSRFALISQKFLETWSKKVSSARSRRPRAGAQCNANTRISCSSP